MEDLMEDRLRDPVLTSGRGAEDRSKDFSRSEAGAPEYFRPFPTAACAGQKRM